MWSHRHDTPLEQRHNPTMTLEEVFVSVWNKALVDGARTVKIGTESFPVTSTAKQSLRQVNFRFDNRDFRGIEQNLKTKSRRAKMARSGKKVMQFVEGGRYVAVVADGKYIPYKKTKH